jgi:hypothetical protein
MIQCNILISIQIIFYYRVSNCFLIAKAYSSASKAPSIYIPILSSSIVRSVASNWSHLISSCITYLSVYVLNTQIMKLFDDRSDDR